MIPWHVLARLVYRIKRNADFSRFEDSVNLVNDPLQKKHINTELKADSLLRLFTLANGGGAVASITFIGAGLAATTDKAHLAVWAYWIFFLFAIGSLVAWLGHAMGYEAERVVWRITKRGEDVHGILRDKLGVLLECLPVVAYLSGSFAAVGLIGGLIALHRLVSL